MTRVLRVSFALGGAAFVALGVLAAVIAIEGRNGPTTLLGRLGHIWELAFTVALVPIVVALVLACRAVRSNAGWVLSALTVAAFAVAAVLAIVRFAGLISLFLPLANWVPGSILLAVSSWVIARAAVRRGILPASMGRAAGVIVIAEAAISVATAAGVLLSGTNAAAVNISAGLALGGAWAAVGLWWLVAGLRWGRVAIAG